MNVKMTFSAVSAAAALCCGVFVCTASAQDDDLWGDYSTPTEMSMPDEPAPGWEPLSGPPEEKPAANKPVKAARTKPEKAPKPSKTARAPKPAKEPKQRAAPVGNEDKTLNIFVNTGAGFGIGGYLEVVGNPNSNEKDHYVNMAEGWRFEAGAGYMVMPNLEARFSADLNWGLLAPTVEGTHTNSGNGGYVHKYSYSSWGIRAMAVPQFEVLELLDMYVGAGLSLNFANGKKTIDTTWTEEATRPPGSNNVVYDMRFKWPAVGFCGLVGFTLPLSEMMDFFGELQFESKSFTLDRLYRANYTGREDNSGGPDSEIIYEKNISDRFPPPLYSGSSWGIRVGMRFWFGL